MKIINSLTGRRLSLIAGSCALIFGTLACVLNVGGPAYPADRIPVSTEAVTQVQDVLGTADAQAAQSGQVSLALTEPQVTSYLAYTLQQDPQPLITDPQVYLRDGEIQIYGKAAQGYFSGTVKAVVTIGIDAEGQPKIDLVSADFGPLPVPPSLRDMIVNTVRKAYADALGPAVDHFKLEKVTVADGMLTLVGTIQ
jgi:hypothetical protein